MTGLTLLAAKILGRRYIGIELDAEYAKGRREVVIDQGVRTSPALFFFAVRENSEYSNLRRSDKQRSRLGLFH